jgi:hypothetical protein
LENLSATEIAVFGTVAVGFIAAASSVITSFINKRSEERKSLRDSVIKTATENYRFIVEKSTNPKHLPLPIYLIYVSKMADLAFDKTVTAENIKTKLTEISKLVTIMEDHTKEVTRGGVKT